MIRLLCIVTLICTSTVVTAVPSLQSIDDSVVTTRHQIRMGQRTLRYTARAGLLPIRHNETGEIHGNMFFVAYLLDRLPKDPPRPITFLWNGGPGANSTLVHLAGFGPRRIKSNDDPTGPPECECEFEDNQTTWLDQTDLVFVDPIGTGFSRPTKPEFAEEFYNTLGDIASVAEFIRVYLTRFDALDAPLFIGGESYGVWRAAGVAEALARRGRRVAGMILISGGIPVGPVVNDEMRAAMFVPTRAAAAVYHSKLQSELQSDPRIIDKATEWARTQYGPALLKREQLTESEKEKILNQLARFTGVDASSIDKRTLILGRQQFAEQLLRDKKQVLARFDTRLTTSRENPGSQRGQLISGYLRSTLKFNSDLAYEGIEEGFTPGRVRGGLAVGSRWNYNQGPPLPPGTPPNSDAPPGGSQPWLRRSIAIDPSIKAFVAVGLYDSVNSCALNSYVVELLEPQEKRNVTAKCYQGGHMMYDSREARLQLKQDVSTFIRETLASRPPAR